MSIIGGFLGAGEQASGYDQAAQLETQFGYKALAQQESQYQQNRTDQLPWLTTGGSALDQLAKIYGLSYVGQNGQKVTGSGFSNVDPNATFYQSPDYKFQMSQGLRGINANASALGGLDSGAIRKADISYAGNLASSQFDNYANRLINIAGAGQNSAMSLGQLGQANANAQSQLYQNIGVAQGNAAIGSANAYANAIGGAFGALGGGGYSSYGSGSGGLGSILAMLGAG